MHCVFWVERILNNIGQSEPLKTKIFLSFITQIFYSNNFLLSTFHFIIFYLYFNSRLLQKAKVYCIINLCETKASIEHVSLRDWALVFLLGQSTKLSFCVTANREEHERQDSNFKGGGLVGPPPYLLNNIWRKAKPVCVLVGSPSHHREWNYIFRLHIIVYISKVSFYESDITAICFSKKKKT